MTPFLFLAQRATAAILALAVLVHLATILYAAQSGLNAGQILSRTQGNVPFFLFYLLFVAAAAVHAPIGLRNVLQEWTGWRGASLNGAMIAFSILVAVLGFRAAFAVFR